MKYFLEPQKSFGEHEAVIDKNINEMLAKGYMTKDEAEKFKSAMIGIVKVYLRNKGNRHIGGYTYTEKGTLIYNWDKYLDPQINVDSDNEKYNKTIKDYAAESEKQRNKKVEDAWRMMQAYFNIYLPAVKKGDELITISEFDYIYKAEPSVYDFRLWLDDFREAYLTSNGINGEAANLPKDKKEIYDCINELCKIIADIHDIPSNIIFSDKIKKEYLKKIQYVEATLDQDTNDITDDIRVAASSGTDVKKYLKNRIDDMVNYLNKKNYEVKPYVHKNAKESEYAIINSMAMPIDNTEEDINYNKKERKKRLEYLTNYRNSIKKLIPRAEDLLKQAKEKDLIKMDNSEREEFFKELRKYRYIILYPKNNDYYAKDIKMFNAHAKVLANRQKRYARWNKKFGTDLKIEDPTVAEDIAQLNDLVPDIIKLYEESIQLQIKLNNIVEDTYAKIEKQKQDEIDRRYEFAVKRSLKSTTENIEEEIKYLNDKIYPTMHKNLFESHIWSENIADIYNKLKEKLDKHDIYSEETMELLAVTTDMPSAEDYRNTELNDRDYSYNRWINSEEYGIKRHIEEHNKFCDRKANDGKFSKYKLNYDKWADTINEFKAKKDEFLEKDKEIAKYLELIPELHKRYNNLVEEMGETPPMENSAPMEETVPKEEQPAKSAPKEEAVPKEEQPAKSVNDTSEDLDLAKKLQLLLDDEAKKAKEEQIKEDEKLAKKLAKEEGISDEISKEKKQVEEIKQAKKKQEEIHQDKSVEKAQPKEEVPDTSNDYEYAMKLQKQFNEEAKNANNKQIKEDEKLAKQLANENNIIVNKSVDKSDEEVQRLKEEYAKKYNNLKSHIQNMSDKEIDNYLRMNPSDSDVMRHVKSEEDFIDIDKYFDFTKDQDVERRKLFNKNDIEVLQKEYANELKKGRKGVFDVKCFIQERVRKLQNINQASWTAAINNTGLPYNVPTVNGDSIKLAGVTQNGVQSTKNGCWSVALSTMLRYRGVEIGQTDIRGFRPNDTFGDEDMMEANRDLPMSINDYVDLINMVLPNTSLNSADIAVADRDTARKNLTDIVRRGLGKDNSPVAIAVGGHYYTIASIENDTLHILDPFEFYETDVKIDEFLDKCLNKKLENGNYTFSAQWLSSIQVTNDRKPVLSDNDLSAQMAKAKADRDFLQSRLPETDDYESFTYNTSEGFVLTSVIPKKLYTSADLQKRKVDAIAEINNNDKVMKQYQAYSKWEDKKNKLEEKINDAQEFIKQNHSAEELRDYEKTIATLKKEFKELDDNKPDKTFASAAKKYMIPYQAYDVSMGLIKYEKEWYEQNKAALDQISNAITKQLYDKNMAALDEYRNNAQKVKDIPNKAKNNANKADDNRIIIQDVEVEEDIAGKDRDDIEKEQDKADQQKFKDNIIEIYEALKTTKDHGTGSHAIYNKMMEDLTNYKLYIYEGYDLLVFDKQRLVDDLYKSCAMYLNSHLCKKSNGTSYIDGQLTKDGAIRKQAVVKLLENMSLLDEFKNVSYELQNRPDVARDTKVTRNNIKLDFENLKFRNELKASLESHLKTSNPSRNKNDKAFSDLNNRIAKVKNQKLEKNNVKKL